MKNWGLDRVAGKYCSAVHFLAQSSLTQGSTICELFNSGFTDFMKKGVCINCVPETCKDDFDVLRLELDFIYKKVEKDRKIFCNKFPNLKNEAYKITPSSVVANMRRGKRTNNIISSICNIAFELNCLKESQNDINYVPLTDS